MRRIALITGASSGIGCEFYFQLMAQDTLGKISVDEFWLVARRHDRLEALPGRKKRIFALDLEAPEARDVIALALAQAKEESQETLQITYLIQAAGYGKHGALDAHSRGDQVGQVRLNGEALVDLAYICLPYLGPGSQVIHVASVAAFLPQPYFASYAASKALVHSLTLALHYEWKKRGIQVLSMCPGPVDTGFARRSQETSAGFKNSVGTQGHGSSPSFDRSKRVAKHKGPFSLKSSDGHNGPGDGFSREDRTIASLLDPPSGGSDFPMPSLSDNLSKGGVEDLVSSGPNDQVTLPETGAWGAPLPLALGADQPATSKLKSLGKEDIHSMVRQALQKVKKGRKVSLTTWPARLIYYGGRFLPKSFIFFLEEKTGVFRD